MTTVTTTPVTNKKALAAQIFMEMKATNPGVKRKEVLFAFVEKAGLTMNGASTYYANFGDNGIWKDAVSGKGPIKVNPAPQTGGKVKEEVDFDKMGLFELTKYFNDHARFNVERFKSTEEAIDMIKKYVK